MTKKWLRLIILVLMVVPAAVAGVLLLRSTPEKAVVAYIAAVTEYDQDRVNLVLSAESVRLIAEIRARVKRATWRDPFQELAMRLIGPARDDRVDIRVCRATVRGNVAVVPLEYKVKGDAATAVALSTAQPSVACVRERDAWRVDFARRLRNLRDASSEGSGLTPLVPELIQAVRYGDANVCSDAEEILVNLGPAARAAVPALIERLDPNCRMVREGAAQALGSIGPEAEAAIPALAGEMAASGSGEAAIYADALAGIGPAAVPALAAGLNGDMPWLRTCVAYELASMGPDAKAALPALRKALKDEYEEVREAAGEAIRKIEGTAPESPTKPVAATK